MMQADRRGALTSPRGMLRPQLMVMDVTSSYPTLKPLAGQTTDSLAVGANTFDLLDMTRVASHVEGAIARGRYPGSNDPVEYLRAKQCLIEVGTELCATVAGILCFGKNPQAILPRAVVDLGHYHGINAHSQEVVNLLKDVKGTIFNQIDTVQTYLWGNVHHGMTLVEGTSQRVEIHAYPQAVIRELTVNMLAHRDYANFISAARVSLFRDRIEWASPGGLPPGITIENILREQASRNPFILQVLYEAGYVEAFGQGLDTVVLTLEREHMGRPRFEDTGASFIVSVFGKQSEVFNSDPLMNGLNEYQRLIYTRLRSSNEATLPQLVSLFAERSQRSVQRDIERLIEAGLIRRIGEGRALRYRLIED
jgi:predicted HTH transcriptional regulator